MRASFTVPAQLSLCQHGPQEAWQGDLQGSREEAAKKAMAKKVAAKPSPKRPNKLAVTAVKLELGAAQESEEASGSGVGLDRGLVSSLLTSLKSRLVQRRLFPAEAGRSRQLGRGT